MLPVHLVLAALAIARVSANGGSTAPPPFRKTLSFGPTLPHARFARPITNDATSDAARDPVAIGRDFLESLGHVPIHEASTSQSAYSIRGDSYLDKNTGVYHLFARQFIAGLEVADGNINLNIQNGRVVSFGDSFYQGPATSELATTALATPPTEHTLGGHCALLSEHISLYGGEAGAHQHVFSSGGAHGLVPSMAQVHTHTCERLPLVSEIPVGESLFDVGNSATNAALSFMLHATPSAELADEIAKDFNGLAQRIVSTPVQHLHFEPGQNPWEETLYGVPGAVAPVKAHMAFVQTPTDQGSALHLVWKLEVEMTDNWYDAAVSVADPRAILSVTDWVSDSPFFPAPTPPKDEPASAPLYNVFPWGVNAPDVGERDKLNLEPDSIASPIGWHSIPLANDPSYLTARPPRGPEPSVIMNYTTTFGNNVFAQENWGGRSQWLENYRAESTTKWPMLTFDFPYAPKKAVNETLAEAQSWINATITQLFVTSNMWHDMFYRYGFDEVSGNFQQTNFGRGGRENDAVIANAQDGSGFNNANFATPPDGQNPRCRMYIWNTANPYRDGDLEAGIVIHELSHGMSTRLTGGPADPSCLGFGEAGGMGEGWGDFFATMIRSNKTYSDYSMGAWAANTAKGIRNYIYSTNFTVNPTTYKTLDKPGFWGVHAIGEVWAEMLWILAQKLIAKHGFADSLLPPQPGPDGVIPEGDFYRTRASPDGPLVPTHGNSLAIQLVSDAMKLQPCRPGFFDARDAIIQADEILTGGENFCEIWTSFAERGLGPDATVVGRTPWGGGVRHDDFDAPRACRAPIPEPDPAPEDPEPEDPGKDKKKKKHGQLESVMFGDW